MFTTFYNETIRKTVVAFGSLFDEIKVQRRNSSGDTVKRLLVPLTFAPKEKFIRMLDEYANTKGQTDSAAIASVMPRMGFNITSINYDSARKRNTSIKRFASASEQSIQTQFAEVPYTVGFQLAVMTRTMDDALQIVEQIVPYFTPEFTMTLNFSDFNTSIDVPFVLNTVSPEVQYEGDTSEQRSIIYTFDFTAYTYVFSPTKTQKIITQTDITTFTSFFNESGITGPTGAASRTITSVTGATGRNTLPPIAGISQDLFTFPNTLSITGATLNG